MTSSVILPTTAGSGQSDCGCGPGDTVSCRLDCLVQPRFFYGQLLTDQDLTALLTWSQDKLRLARHRQGWGVVCGLEVRGDPRREGHVIVGPGYAVSDCGDDIVVCADSDPYDLSGACFRTDAACGELRKKPNGTTPQPGAIGGYSFTEDEVRYVDLYLHYAEEGTSPQTALGRRVCGQTEVCEYGRTREWYRLAYTVSDGYADGDYTDPLDRAAKEWHAKLNAIWSDLRPLTDASDRWELLRQRIDRQSTPQDQSLRSFGFVYDYIEQARRREGGPTERDFHEILFWVTQDRRNAYLGGQCASVQTSPGVPLARVRVRRSTDSAGRQHCTVLDIDAFPPYRRPLGPSDWPAPLGSVNLGRLIWRRWAEASSLLAGLGVKATEERLPLPTTAAQLDALFTCPGEEYPLFVTPGAQVYVRTVDTGRSGVRVVSFCRTSGSSNGSGEETPAPSEAPAPRTTRPRPGR